MGGILRNMTVCALGVQTEEVDFVETGFTGWMDILVVRYRVTNSGLQRNNRFCFQGNVVQSNRL
jgi:hypothetical protein